MRSTSFSRRTVLQGTAAGIAAAAVLPRAVYGKAVQEEKKVGFAFVGLGGYATQQMLPQVKATKHVKVAALVSGTPEKLSRYGEQYGVREASRYSYETMDKIKDNPEVDVVYVVLPTGMHADYAVRGFAAGKHVMCEKPMAITVADCQRMIDAGQKAGKKLDIGYRCHLEPNNLEAIRMCREKELGVLRVITTDMGFPVNSKSWRTTPMGGGALYDIGIYGLNACRYLSGEEPVEVWASAVEKPGDVFEGVPASWTYGLKFPSGVMAINSTSYDYVNENRYRCAFTDGEFTMESATGYGGFRMMVKGRGKDGQRKKPEINQFATEMDAFAEAILNDKPARSPGEEGLRDIRVFEAIHEAVATGKVVKLAEMKSLGIL